MCKRGESLFQLLVPGVRLSPLRRGGGITSLRVNLAYVSVRRVSLRYRSRSTVHCDVFTMEGERKPSNSLLKFLVVYCRHFKGWVLQRMISQLTPLRFSVGDMWKFISYTCVFYTNCSKFNAPQHYGFRSLFYFKVIITKFFLCWGEVYNTTSKYGMSNS